MVVLVVEVELILITQVELEQQTKGSLVGQLTTPMVVVVVELLRQEQKEPEIAHLQVELVEMVETD
tara:strand:+ start:321 stop:518 length:198 start_codon:yes stop_codon:yes gene_type:complete